MSKRLSRVEEATKEVLSEVIQREVKDPRVGFVTISRVDISPDLRHAGVYYSVLGDDAEVKRTIEGLESSRGYMRSALGKHLRLKYLPDIDLVREDVSGDAIRLAELLNRVAEEMGDDEDVDQV